MYTPVSEEVFTIECDTCGYNVAYFYEDGSPERFIIEDDWHKTSNTDFECSACYIPPFPELHLEKWTIQDLLLIAPPRDYHTRSGIIHHILLTLAIDSVPEELRERYCE